MESSTEYGEEGSAKNALRIAAITGVLAAPSAILLVPGLGSIYLALCVFAGVLIALQQRQPLKSLWKNNGAVRWLGILLLAYLLVSMGNFVLIDSSDFAFSRLERQLILLAIPAVFVLLWWARPTILAVHAGIALNAATFGVYAIASYIHDGQRVQAVTNWVLFGNAGLLLGFSALGLFFLRPSWPLRALGVAGLALGVAASLLSWTRGGWLAIPLLVAISLFALHKVYRPSRWLWVGIGLAATMLLVLFLNTGIVQDRIAQGERDVALMTDGNFQTSLGLRMLMWKIALETGLEAPLLGQGFSGYLRKVDGLLEKEDIPPIMALFRTEPHSDYLYLFASRGLLGLIAYGALLIIPFTYLLVALGRGDARKVGSAYVGLTLIIVLAVSGLSITMVDQRAMIRFISVVSAIALYAVWETQRARPPRDSLGQT
jgi:O-antigen ligase